MSNETLKAIETSIERYVTNSSPELLQEILGATAFFLNYPVSIRVKCLDTLNGIKTGMA